MKINEKDVASGLFFILVALAGLLINGGFFGLGWEQHALGNPRRMGPGYMPMLVLWGLLGLGALTLVLGLFEEPDRLERWTGIESGSLGLAVVVGFAVGWFAPAINPAFESGYIGLGLGLLAGFAIICIAMGWRIMGAICAGMCAFCLLLDSFGLMIALVATIFISAAAEPEHRARPVAVLGLTVFLLALCWWVFIKQLDIRVNVWPQF
jgi:hypothetical protein